MVTLSRFRGRDPFCDPFCGSGTICIEAALIAMNRAPGLDRSFDAQRWGFVPSGDWLTAAGEAMDKEFHGRYDIWGGDVDPRAVAIARDNARKAGVEDVVRFEVADMRNFRRDDTYGQLVTNPPTASGCWSGRRPRPCTGTSAKCGSGCRTPGGRWSSAATRNLSAPSATRPRRSASSITA